MTPPIRMVSVPVEDLLFYKLKDLILEQSEGEWDDATIVRDAHHFANHIRPLLTAAPVREEGGAFKLGESDLFEVADIIRTARGVKHVGFKDYAVADEIVCFINNHPRNSAAALATREGAPAEAGERQKLIDDLRYVYNQMTPSALERMDSDGAAVILERAIEHIRAQPQAREEAQPVAWVSPKQFSAHTDFSPTESETGGRYLPVRRTPAGNFTQPLYTTPPAPEAEKLRVAVEALEKASRAISAQYALAQAEYQHLDTVASKHDKIVQEGRRAIREALAALQQGGRS